MNNSMIINGDIIANGTVYANGPVIVQGMDIKAELIRLRNQFEKLDEGFSDRIEEVLLFMVQNFEMSLSEKTDLQNALIAFKAIVDWDGRIQFIVGFLQTINPIISIMIINLVKYVYSINLVIDK